jgi:hypothetical protein
VGVGIFRASAEECTGVMDAIGATVDGWKLCIKRGATFSGEDGVVEHFFFLALCQQCQRSGTCVGGWVRGREWLAGRD